MPDRRSFLAAPACVATALPRLAQAQREARIYRIGFLSPTTPDAGNLPQLLAELGYVPGRNAEFVQRFASGNPERLPALAAELVANKVDVIVATAPPAIRAALGATKKIPTVLAFSGAAPLATA